VGVAGEGRSLSPSLRSRCRLVPAPAVRQTTDEARSAWMADRIPGRYLTLSATATAPAPQHLRALAQANRVRLARAELKRQVAEDEISVAEVVLSCPWEAESMAIADLLMSQHRWGRTRCRRFLAALPMSETKTIGSMTDRQRRALSELLAD
jgi:hypothetical protein